MKAKGRNGPSSDIDSDAAVGASKRRGRGRTKIDLDNDAASTGTKLGDDTRQPLDASAGDGSQDLESPADDAGHDIEATNADGTDLELFASEGHGSSEADGSEADGSEIDVANGHDGSDVDASSEIDVDLSNGHGGSEIAVDPANDHDGCVVDASSGTDLAVEASTVDGDGDAIDGPLPELPSSAAAMDARQLKHLVEALIFASDKPVTAQRLRQLTRVGEVRRLEQALAELAEDYRDRGLVLQQVSGGYQFRTRTQFSVWVQQLIAGRPVRLSRAQLETLAIVAYRQPITRPEIDDIRGVDSSQTLKLLHDRALVRVLGKKEEAGRPLLYGTTKEFLDFFSLGDLRELPTLREYSELTDESRRVMSDRLGDEAPAEDATDDSDAAMGEHQETRSLEDDLQAYVDADDEPHPPAQGNNAGHGADFAAHRVTNGVRGVATEDDRDGDDHDDVHASTSDYRRDRSSAEASDPTGEERRHAVEVSAEASGQTGDDHDGDVRGQSYDRSHRGDHVSAETSGETGDDDHEGDLQRHSEPGRVRGSAESCDHVSAETGDDHDGDVRDESHRGYGDDRVSAETSGQPGDDHHAEVRARESDDRSHVSAEPLEPTGDDHDDRARERASAHGRDHVSAEASGETGDDRDGGLPRHGLEPGSVRGAAESFGETDDHHAGVRRHEGHDHAHVRVSAENPVPTGGDHDDNVHAPANTHRRDHAFAETVGQVGDAEVRARESDDHAQVSAEPVDPIGDDHDDNVHAAASDHRRHHVSAETSGQTGDAHDAEVRGHVSNDHVRVSAETSGQIGDTDNGDGDYRRAETPDMKATDDQPVADREIELHASLNDPRVIGYAAGSVDLDSLEAIPDEASDVEALAEAAVDELGASDAPTGAPNVDPVAPAPDTDERTRRGS